MAFLGVVTTFSRTGIILMLLPVIVYCIKNISRGISIATVLKTFILLVVFIFCAVYFAVFIIDNFDLSSDALMRVDSLLYGNLSESYSEARGDLASYMLDVYMQSPVFGNGVGYASIFPEGTHNMFLYIAIDMGIIGLLYYILLIARVVTMRMRQLLMLNVNGIMSIALICWLVLYGFASHNIIYDMPLLLPLSFIVLGPRNYA
ncbi:MAG: hypothetical protein BWK76_17030 [Desulfobulbaceae bacterium A2]|nr:MAG: hypothetical protein BWK76_17030 [Desulfobulbaceae bacterium A2]